VIVISYLKLTGTPAHVRHLIALLRQRAPQAAIVLGLWPKGESILSDRATQQTVGADYYVDSLRGALERSIGALARADAPGSGKAVNAR
jgi:hypothetical protein